MEKVHDYAKPISFRNNSAVGVLVLHGFSGATISIKYLAENLNKARFNVEAPRLSGHGTEWEDLSSIKYQDWLYDIENSLDLLKKRASTIFIVGLSMGGTLALYLAQKYPDIAGIVLINHAIFLQDPLFPLIPIAKFFIKTAKGVGNDIKDKSKDEKPYSIVSTNGANELYKIIKLVKSKLKLVNQPTLIFKSVEDHVVHFKSAGYTYDKISSVDKEIIWLKNSYHVATMDYEKDTISKKTIEFIKKLSINILSTIREKSNKITNNKKVIIKKKPIKRVKAVNKTKPVKGKSINKKTAAKKKIINKSKPVKGKVVNKKLQIKKKPIKKQKAIVNKNKSKSNNTGKPKKTIKKPIIRNNKNRNTKNNRKK